MSGRRVRHAERLNTPPLRVPRPRTVLGVVRWITATVLLGIAALLLTGSAGGRPGDDTVPVLAAARDLAPGVPLRAGDVHVLRLPAAAVPQGVLRPSAKVVGRSVAEPVRRGEPLTDVRLMGPALVDEVAGAGAVATPVRISDAGAARLLHSGDRLDLIAAGDEGPDAGKAQVIASDVAVLSIPPAAEAGAAEGALIVVATSPEVATRLAAAAVGSTLSVAVRGR